MLETIILVYNLMLIFSMISMAVDDDNEKPKRLVELSAAVLSMLTIYALFRE